jgi:error-prone DNA polymerase
MTPTPALAFPRQRGRPGGAAQEAAHPAPPAGFAELAALSNFTFLEGASHPKELVAEAKALGHAGIGIADRNTFAGLVRGHVAAVAAGLRFVPGVRLCLPDGWDYLAWPTDRAAYGRLATLLSQGRMAAPKGECHIGRDDLIDAAEGSVLALVPPDAVDTAFADRLARDAAALRHRLALPLFCAAAHRFRGDDRKRLDRLAVMAAAAGSALLAAGQTRYHAPARRPLADVLTAIRLGTTVDALGHAAERHAEAHLKPAAEMQRLFHGHEAAVDNTLRVAAACGFSLRELSYDYPEEIPEPGLSAQDTLERRVAAAVEERWPAGPPPKVEAQIAHELRLIGQMGYAPYFLTVHEIVRFAQSRAILCQGRGSAANSAVCYALGITSVAPDKHDLLFERFISASRNEPPDIDVDFEHERREEVIQHIYARYGRHRAAIAATVIRYRERSAIREVGKALGLTEDVTGRLAKAVWGAGSRSLAEVAADQGLDPARDRRLALACALAEELLDFPRHLATHVGGFVITRGPLTALAVVTKAAMADRHTIEWDKDDIEALRILKVDVLGLGMLSCIRRAFALIAAHGGPALTLATVPQDDPATYAMLRRADSLGVFQVESRAQMNMLPRLKPRAFYDLVIQVAIVRPGPIQGDMVHPYLRRRNGEEPVTYPSDALRQVLGKTLGVPLFQEQAMQIAIVGAGFTPARADELRRAMATFRHVGTIWQFQQEFVEGMARNGYAPDFAARCFRQIEGFGTYGFPESHAAAFAQLVYVSAWIKCHHPAAFAAALLNSQPMGFYAPAQIVRDAREHGVQVRPVDAQASDWDCTLEPAADSTGGLALRLGMRLVQGLSAPAAGRIVAVRQRDTGSTAPFPAATQPAAALAQMARKAGLDRGALERLAEADAFRSLGLPRRHALWDAAGVEAPTPLETALAEAAPGLAEPAAGEETVLDYTSTGLTLRHHPLRLLRPHLDALGLADTRRLHAARRGAWLRLPGLVLVRQRPGSAKGVVFFTVEDEWGVANLVLYPDRAARFRSAVVAARLVIAEGRVERLESSEVPIIHLIVHRLHDRSALLGELAAAEDPVWRRALARADEVERPDLRGDPRARFPQSRDFR